jgi:hypothetical protein
MTEQAVDRAETLSRGVRPKSIYGSKNPTGCSIRWDTMLVTVFWQRPEKVEAIFLNCELVTNIVKSVKSIIVHLSMAFCKGIVENW